MHFQKIKYVSSGIFLIASILLSPWASGESRVSGNALFKKDIPLGEGNALFKKDIPLGEGNAKFKKKSFLGGKRLGHERSHHKKKVLKKTKRVAKKSASRERRSFSNFFGLGFGHRDKKISTKKIPNDARAIFRALGLTGKKNPKGQGIGLLGHHQNNQETGFAPALGNALRLR